MGAGVRSGAGRSLRPGVGSPTDPRTSVAKPPPAPRGLLLPRRYRDGRGSPIRRGQEPETRGRLANRPDRRSASLDAGPAPAIRPRARAMCEPRQGIHLLKISRNGIFGQPAYTGRVPRSIFGTRNVRFRHRLKKMRVAANLTQEHLADRLDRPQSFVAKYEGGERRLDVIEFMEIAEAIGFDPAEFIGRFDASDDTSHDGGTPSRDAGPAKTGRESRDSTAEGERGRASRLRPSPGRQPRTSSR